MLRLHPIACLPLLVCAGCAWDQVEWDEEDEIGSVQQAIDFSGTLPGYVTTSSTDSFANRCAVNPVQDVEFDLDVDPAYILAYRSGKSSCGVAATYFVGAPADYHRQSIQRINRNSTNYLLVSHSVTRGNYPGVEVIELGARTGTRYDLGAAGVTPSTWPNCEDHIAKYYEYPSTIRNHIGGMQVNGRFLVIPIEDTTDDNPAAFRTIDLNDPVNPISGPTVFRTKGQTTNGGAAALTRLNDEHFMVMVFGNNSQDVEVFVSTGTGFPTTAGQWESKDAWATNFGPTHYQNVQFITRCDGRLYVLGTHDDGGDDWADLYQVTFTSTYRPTFVKVKNRNMKCNTAATGGVRYCDFDAGAGPYVDPAGNLILYAVEHWNDAYPETGPGPDDYGVKVREFPQ